MAVEQKETKETKRAWLASLAAGRIEGSLFLSVLGAETLELGSQELRKSKPGTQTGCRLLQLVSSFSSS
jgi:hypothetical protein